MMFQDALNAKAAVRLGFKTVEAAIKQFLVIIQAVTSASLKNGVVHVMELEMKE